MATDTPATVINGYEYDWSSIDYVVDGIRFTGSYKKIDYEKKRERGMTRGKGPKRRGVTRGKETCSASFSMFKADFQRFKDQLLASPAAGPLDSYMDVPFNKVICYEENGLVITDTLVTCRVNSAKDSHSNDSQDALYVDVELDLFDILHDGDS